MRPLPQNVAILATRGPVERHAVVKSAAREDAVRWE